MAVSDEYLAYVLDQLANVGPVQSRHMFGGAGLYLHGVFFALIAEDVLYLKVDDSNRRDYEAAGMSPFQPSPGKPTVMQYYEVPPEVLENTDMLRDWAQKALNVARRARRK
jgi:DNA transformation protein